MLKKAVDVVLVFQPRYMSDFIGKHLLQLDQLSSGRMLELDRLAKLIKLCQKEGISDVLFVCTHNSRRSQIAELSLAQALDEVGYPNLKVHSCGTESTSIPQQIKDLYVSKGYIVSDLDGAVNVSNGNWSKNIYSKTIDDGNMPDRNIAVMVCDHASESCPHSPKFMHRYNLNYTDPKLHDGTEQESKAYQKAYDKISREMVYLALKLDEL